jgi:hypothetical protein
LKVLTIPSRSEPITKTLNTFKWPRSSINTRLHHNQVEVWVSQMHFVGELITVQVRVTIKTSPSYPLSCFKSMCSQVQDLKVMSKISYKKFDAVFVRATLLS